MRGASWAGTGIALALTVVSSLTVSPASAQSPPVCRVTVSSAPETMSELASAYASNPSVVTTNGTDAFLGSASSGHNVIEAFSAAGRELWVKQVAGAPGFLMANASTLAYAQFHGVQPFHMNFYNLSTGHVVQGAPLRASGSVLYSYTAFPGGFLVASDFAYSDPSRNTVYLDIYTNTGKLRAGVTVPAPGDTAPVDWSVSGSSLFVAVPSSPATSPQAVQHLTVFEITAHSIRRYSVSPPGGASYIDAVAPNAAVLSSRAETGHTNPPASGWSFGASAKLLWAKSLTIAGPVIQGPGSLLYSAGDAFSPVSGSDVKVFPGLEFDGLTGDVVADLGTGIEVVTPWLATQHGLIAFEQAFDSSQTSVVLLSPSGSMLQRPPMRMQSGSSAMSLYRPLVVQGKESVQILSPLLGQRTLVLPVAGCGEDGPALGR